MRGPLLLLLSMATAPEQAIQSWPYRACLGSLTSHQDETVHDFMARAGKALENHTRATGHEACGVVAARENYWSILVFSDGVQRGCSMNHQDTLVGFSSTRETLHSHPDRDSIVLSTRDREWNARHGQRISTHTLVIRPGFSPADMKAGPGWLAERGALHYYDGTGRAGRRVARLANETVELDQRTCLTAHPKEHPLTRE